MFTNGYTGVYICMSVGNIGGLMGIFLGASLLSLVELVEFFVLCLSPRNKLVSNEISVAENGMATHPRQTTEDIKKNIGKHNDTKQKKIKHEKKTTNRIKL